MVRFEKSAGAVVYYLDRKRKPYFLLLKYPNYWGFPKGLIEENESEKETAIREIGEETGLKDIKFISDFECWQEWFYRLNDEIIKKKAVFFLVETTENEAKKVKISFEHDDFCWCSLNESLNKMKIKSNKELIKKAYEFIKKESKQKKLF